MEQDINSLLIDINKELVKSNEMKDKIIRELIAAIVLVVLIFVVGFFWYESQFEYATEETTTTETTTTTTEDNDDIDITSEGDNAEASYIEGDQYNDNATYTEGGVD